MQTTSQNFLNHAKGSIRPISWGVRISFDKSFTEDIQFVTLDQSNLNSGHMLAPTTAELQTIQRWDYYKYQDYSARATMVEWTREMSFPDSVSAAMGDFVLENYNNYFTPNSGSPIAPFIIPKRPVRLLGGFNNELIPQFIGITESMPEIDKEAKTATFHAIDFLAQMYSQPLTEVVAMTNVRTDEVLAALFTQFGLQPEQYDLAQGYNTISYVYFDKDKNAGNAFRDLMQAEMGNLWLDESGVIKFEPRIILNQDIAYRFDNSNVVSIKIIGADEIINSVKINADIRHLMPYQKIWSMDADGSGNIKVPANTSIVFAADLEDPALNIVQPTRGEATDTSYFTAVKAIDQTAVTTNITITGSVAKNNNFTMFFQNNNAFDVEINALQLWGEPARIADRIRYVKRELDSIAKYEERVLEIDNDFIQSIDACDSLALTVLDSFAEYAGQIEMTVKGNFALQLADNIYVAVDGYEGTYKIKKITNRIQEGRYTQTIVGRKQTPRDYFVLDTDQLNSANVLSI